QRREHAADQRQFDETLGEVGERLLRDQPLETRGRRYFGELRRQDLERPNQLVLDQVAAERRQQKKQERDRDSRDRLGADPLKQPRQRRTVHIDRVRIDEQPTHGGGQFRGHAAGEHHQHQGGAGNDEPGIDLLALDDIAALERLVETLL